MDVGKVLAELRQELELLSSAIASLERLQHVHPRKAPREERRAAAEESRGSGVKVARQARKAE